jgi:hypothetical protein
METIWFHAPSNVPTDSTCRLCGDQIRPNELIAEEDGQYTHEDCLAWQIEDQMEDCR